MKEICGCCAGIEIATPVSEVNPPGLSAIQYRAGTYATFFETMLARLSNLYLDIPSTSGSDTDRIFPLKQLTTRDSSDSSIALLDAWATVADVLTFYQERVANEGYLLTATERRSILELARLVGYRLRPGVSASAYLAFTVANGFNGTIPTGTRAQSIPGTSETAQFFETSDALVARDTWNNLKPRMTRPQLITPAAQDDKGIPLVTGADVIDTVYLDGITTNLKTGDALLFVFGADTAQPFIRMVELVDAQADHNRTEVTLAQIIRKPETIDQVLKLLQLFVDKATFLFPGSNLAQDVAKIVSDLINNLKLVSQASQAADLIRAAIAPLQEKQDIAVQRNFTRVAAWTGHVLQTLQYLIVLASTAKPSGGEGKLTILSSTLATSPLASLVGIAKQLALAPSVQPANALRLSRTVRQSFSPQSDNAPRLLAALKPAAASTLYQAWSNLEVPASRMEVQAARVKAMLFASSYAGEPKVVKSRKNGSFTTSFIAPVIGAAWSSLVSGFDPLPTIPLDATYDQIKRGSWAAIDRPAFDKDGNPVDRVTTYHVVTDVQISVMDTGTGYTAKVTLLTLDPPWLSDAPDIQRRFILSASIPSPQSTAVLRGTVVYTQTEPLDLTEEPLDTDVERDSIDLDAVYVGVEPGRWIIVSGNRTDVPNVSGVTASELVMISGVSQGSQAPLCVNFPSDLIPFSQIYYTTSANARGDRLVVGQLAEPAVSVEIATSTVLEPAYHASMPTPQMLNQQFCDQVELAPGTYANTYVPSDQELQGMFPTFAGLLVDPRNNVPFENGTITQDRIKDGLFAWRISTQALHTILNVASPLAYKYDRGSVTIYGNVVRATHGQTVAEVLGNGDASQVFQKFALHQSPLTYVSAPTPGGTQSTLEVRVNEIEWHEADNLAALSPTDRGYITQTNDADQTSVIFGNGEHGTRPPTGNVNIKAVYRYGIGKPGNVRAQQISQLATHPLGVQGVINPLPATGGADRDSRDQARRNTPVAVEALDRLVSVEDYAQFARAYAGIGKASAARLSDGRRLVVHVTIAGAEDIPIDANSDLYRYLVQALHDFGDPYQAIAVCVRKVKLLVVSANVAILPHYAWESVEPKIRAAMLDAFSFDNRELGQSAFLSEAVSVMQAVGGVAYVDTQVFDSVAEDVTAGQLAALGGTLARNAYVEADLARVNPAGDPANPCERILPAELVFLTPDIPDTLILTQIGG